MGCGASSVQNSNYPNNPGAASIQLEKMGLVQDQLKEVMNGTGAQQLEMTQHQQQLQQQEKMMQAAAASIF